MGLSIDQQKTLARNVCIRAFGFDPEDMRKDSEILAWVLEHPETAAEELADAAAGDGTARGNLERRIGRIGDA